jgi:Holliday junction resolvase RusA-like endonuclease
MMKVNFSILGEPQGKGRPRFARTKAGVITHTPEQTVIYENLVKLEYQRQCENKRFGDDEMLAISIYAFYGMPKSASKKKKAQMLEGTIRPTKKPDLDNVLKVIADSLNGIAYKDDSQIVGASVSKFYSEIPRVVVTIGSLSEVEE